MSHCVSEETLHAYFDGELGREAGAAVVEHLALCDACVARSQTVEETIFFMTAAFDDEFSICVPSGSLRAGLDTKLNSASSLASTALSVTPSPWRAFLISIASWFRMPELFPRRISLVAISALVIAALFIWFVVERRQSEPPSSQSAVRQTGGEESPVPKNNDSPSIREQTQPEDENRATSIASGNEPKKSAPPRRKREVGPRLSPREVIEQAMAAAPDPLVLPADEWGSEPLMYPVVALDMGEERTFFDSETTRHLEQAQVLLRSFKNASFSTGESAAELAYEKEKSRELLYRNILLRRDAEADGNAPVKSLLNELEPFLLDIANLPDRPSPGELKFIKKRLQRNEIVAMLQVYSTRAISSNTFR